MGTTIRIIFGAPPRLSDECPQNVRVTPVVLRNFGG
jgi:hypothetical protein